jgi:hypothetical protein
MPDGVHGPGVEHHSQNMRGSERGEMRPDSDIDLLVEFAADTRFGNSHCLGSARLALSTSSTLFERVVSLEALKVRRLLKTLDTLTVMRPRISASFA